MTRAKAIVVILTVVGLYAGSALGQATKTVIHSVRYDIDRDFSPDVWFTETPAHDDNWHSNTGAGTRLRTKGWQHMYTGDWDAAPMQLHIDPGGQLTGWGSYTPNYYMAIRPAHTTSVNDNGTPADPSDDYINPVSTSSWPADPVAINVSCVWSENDWWEADGITNYLNYNWTNLMGTWAATYMYAGDHAVIGAEIPWSFPGGGTGPSAPYPADPDCTFMGTFLTHGDARDDWQPGNAEPMTPTNSTPYSIDNSIFYLWDINNTPGDPLDDQWWSPYVEVQLDQAMIDDMLQNVNNRGFTLWNIDNWANKTIFSDDQNAACWPYIEARIEACSGDANLDQAVDGLDYVSWSNNYQAAGMGWSGGDFNNDGVTDGLDYVIWSNNYQQSCPGAPGAVPEPATMALLAIGGLAVLKRGRRS